jgi:hypothetical protein
MVHCRGCASRRDAPRTGHDTTPNNKGPLDMPVDDQQAMLEDEMYAMHTIAHALTRLSDPQSRIRVLEWANDQFRTSGDAAPATSIESAPDLDADLGVEMLSDLFDQNAPAAQPAARDRVDQPTDAVESLQELFDDDVEMPSEALHDLFDDPPIGASARAEHPIVDPAPIETDALNDLFEDDTAAVIAEELPPTSASAETAAVAAVTEPEDEQELETLLRNLATELQQVADEWQAA